MAEAVKVAELPAATMRLVGVTVAIGSVEQSTRIGDMLRKYRPEPA